MRLSPAVSQALRVLFGLGIVALLIRQGDLSSAGLHLDARAMTGAVAAVGLLAAAMLLSALRWRLVLGAGAPPVLSLWRVYLIGWFFSLFLPTSVGGDAVRAVAVGRSSGSAGAALSSILLERLLGVAALGFYLLLGFVIAPTVLWGAMGGASVSLSAGQLALLAGAGVLLLGAALFAARRISRLAAVLRDAAGLWDRFRRSPGRLGAALAVSLLVQALYIAVWYELAWSLRLDAPFLAFLVFVPLVSLAAMLPITLAGLGVREGVWAFLLAPFGVALADAVLFSLIYYVCGLLLGAVGGLLFGLSGIRLSPEPEPSLASNAEVASAAVVTTARA